MRASPLAPLISYSHLVFSWFFTSSRLSHYSSSSSGVKPFSSRMHSRRQRNSRLKY